MLDVPVQQQIFVKVTQGGELAGDGAAIHFIAGESIEESPHLLTLRPSQRASSFTTEKVRELTEILTISRQRERRQPFLDL